MLNIMKSTAKKILPKPVLGILLKLRDEFRSKISGVSIVLTGTDWVGYETLIRFIKKKDILSVEGDLVEIGAFLGGGTYKLSKFLEKQRSSKRLYVIDIFDPTFDWTEDRSF
ncbi:MAG TPA: hypothetical protein EYP78_00500 [Candidatus Omnitrophica bacterium]|nr:hypothetical protein [Candidatus Omnitrophota bacterium]